MRTKELNRDVYLKVSELNQEEFLQVVEGMENAYDRDIPNLNSDIIEWVDIGSGYKWYGSSEAESRSELITLDKLKELVGWKCKMTKDLNRSVVYDLRGITKEQAKELYQWILYNEPDWNALGHEQFMENYYLYFNNYRWHFDNDAVHPSITLTKIADMFCEENNSKMKTVTREQLSEIYPLVCHEWQGRIKDLMATNQFGNEFEVSEDLIKKAYQDANEGQKLWLNKYVPLPSIDYSKLKVGSVVRLKYTGKHCDGKNNVDFTKPFQIVYANTPHFIGSNCEVESSGVMKYYYTFIQDGKFILYGSDESQDVNYITEVISY